MATLLSTENNFIAIIRHSKLCSVNDSTYRWIVNTLMLTSSGGV